MATIFVLYICYSYWCSYEIDTELEEQYLEALELHYSKHDMKSTRSCPTTKTNEMEQLLPDIESNPYKKERVENSERIIKLRSVSIG